MHGILLFAECKAKRMAHQMDFHMSNAFGDAETKHNVDFRLAALVVARFKIKGMQGQIQTISDIDDCTM